MSVTLQPSISAQTICMYVDTEFTCLADPRLLSIGAVTEDGREFYAEVDLESDGGQALQQVSSAFVKENVLTQWGAVPGAACASEQIGARLADWLLALLSDQYEEIHVVVDDEVDFELMRQALRCSRRLHLVETAIRQLLVRPIGPAVGEIDAEPGILRRHHSLHDARQLCLRARSAVWKCEAC